MDSKYGNSFYYTRPSMLHYKSNRRIYGPMPVIQRESSQPTSPLTFPESILKKSIEDLPKTPCVKRVRFPQDLNMHPTPKKRRTVQQEVQQDYTLVLLIFVLFFGIISLVLFAFD